jgi:hypothetical protein
MAPMDENPRLLPPCGLRRRSLHVRRLRLRLAPVFFFAVLFLRVRIKSYARFGMTLETAGIRNG